MFIKEHLHRSTCLKTLQLPEMVSPRFFSDLLGEPSILDHLTKLRIFACVGSRSNIAALANYITRAKSLKHFHVGFDTLEVGASLEQYLCAVQESDSRVSKPTWKCFNDFARVM